MAKAAIQPPLDTKKSKYVNFLISDLSSLLFFVTIRLFLPSSRTHVHFWWSLKNHSFKGSTADINRAKFGRTIMATAELYAWKVEQDQSAESLFISKCATNNGSSMIFTLQMQGT